MNGDNDQKLQFREFSYDNKSWMHLACAYDHEKQLLRTSLYDQSRDEQYVQFKSNAAEFEPEKGTYSLEVNSKMKDISYQELRFWNDTRSREEIEMNRFYAVDPLAVNSTKANLKTYLKLSSSDLESQQNLAIYPDFEWAV